MPVLKVHDGTEFVAVPSGTLDAGLIAFAPADVTNWDGDVDPGDVDDALDQLADKKATVTGTNTNNAIMRADGVDGDIQGSSVIVTDAGRVGIGVSSPQELLHVDNAIAISNDAEGSTARLVRRTTRDLVTLSGGATDTTTILIPSGARILAVSMNVNTVVDTTGIGNDTWSAAFITGSTTTIVTDASEVQNTKVDFIVPDEKATATTQIRFSPTGGTFNSGAIEVVAYFEELTSLADV